MPDIIKLAEWLTVNSDIATNKAKIKCPKTICCPGNKLRFSLVKSLDMCYLMKAPIETHKEVIIRKATNCWLLKARGLTCDCEEGVNV
jgi:hypothetical protein